jgi:lysophospholipase L1-like esterase
MVKNMRKQVAGVNYTPQAFTLLAQGDSISTLAAPFPPPTAYPAYPNLAAQWFPAGSVLINNAIGGQTAQVLSGAQTTADVATLNGISGKKYYSIMIGTNDLVTATTPAATYAYLLTIVSAIKATGATIIVFTILPRGDLTDDGLRQAYNTLIIDGATANGYTVANVGVDPLIGIPGAEFNATYYYSDHVHPITAGEMVIVPYLINALNI